MNQASSICDRYHPPPPAQALDVTVLTPFLVEEAKAQGGHVTQATAE
jgi:hypothetical protein